MSRVRSHRTLNFALRIALSAFVFSSFISAGRAQEPPLDVPRAGVLPGPSSGCNAALFSGDSLYGNTILHKTVDNPSAPAHTANVASNENSANDLPLNSAPDPGTNIPLSSELVPGSNIPLDSNPDLYGGIDGTTADINPVTDNGPSVCRSGIPAAGWLIYPSLRLYSLYSNNLFLAPTGQVKAFGFGMTPAVTAQWSNGIHTTTISGNIDHQIYPTDNSINTLDEEATFTQQYAPLDDLTFTALGDYTHKTISSSLTNSIPTAITTATPTATRLPDGNIQLPNGTIVSPTGQILGQAATPVSTGTTLVNPYDQYTGTFSATKLFNRGILSVSDSIARTNYASLQGGGDTAYSSFTTNTAHENSSFWLDPSFYIYSDGTFSTRTTDQALDPNSNAYRTEGGIGTRQFGLFKGSVYFGYQGSWAEGSGIAGGDVYGGKISYFPSLAWTITAALDETINKSSQTVTSTQALTAPSPELIPLSSSTRITTPSLQTQYQLSQQWSLVGNLTYSQIDYIGTARVDNAWFADTVLNYEMWRNLTLSWEYQYTSIVSNAPLQSATRNMIMMSAMYRF